MNEAAFAFNPEGYQSHRIAKGPNQRMVMRKKLGVGKYHYIEMKDWERLMESRSAASGSDADKLLLDANQQMHDPLFRNVLRDALLDAGRDGEADLLSDPVAGSSMVEYRGKIMHPHQIPNQKQQNAARAALKVFNDRIVKYLQETPSHMQVSGYTRQDYTLDHIVVNTPLKHSSPEPAGTLRIKSYRYGRKYPLQVGNFPIGPFISVLREIDSKDWVQFVNRSAMHTNGNYAPKLVDMIRNKVRDSHDSDAVLEASMKTDTLQWLNRFDSELDTTFKSNAPRTSNRTEGIIEIKTIPMSSGCRSYLIVDREVPTKDSFKKEYVRYFGPYGHPEAMRVIASSYGVVWQ